MRILYHHRIRSKDGQYVHMEELIGALRDQGQEVVLCGPGNIEAEDFGADPAGLGWLRRSLPGFLYELLEFGYAFHDLLRLLWRAWRVRPDFIYERYNLFLPSGVWVARLLHLPLVLEVNAPLFDERSRYGGISLARLARWTEVHTWRHADCIMTVTGILRQRILAAGVAPERVLVVPNAIDPRRFDPQRGGTALRRELGIEDRLVIGFTGFVREWHGLDRVVRFLAGHERRDLQLLIVGEGPHCGELRRLAAELGVQDRVRITGVVERAAMPDYIATFDIAVQPDVVPYASPLKLFEYMAMGRPIMAPDRPNIREVLDDDSAVFFDPEQETAFAGALARLVDDAALRHRLGAAARRQIQDLGLRWCDNARRVVEEGARLCGRSLAATTPGAGGGKAE